MSQRISDTYLELEPYIVNLINRMQAAGSGSSGGSTTPAIVRWGDIDKSGSSLGDLANRSHSLLSDFSNDDHTEYVRQGGRGGFAYLDAIARNRYPADNRYRSDWWAFGSGGSALNSYDDVGAVYTPFYLDASVINLRPSGNGSLAFSIAATGAVTAAPATTTQHQFGYAKLGDMGYGATWAGFAHASMGSAGNYALLQSSTGETLINSALAQPVRIRNNNADELILNFPTAGNYALTTSSFTSGFTGNGMRIDHGVAEAGKDSAEFDNLIIRGRMSVYELLVHQIRATNGSIFVSSTGKAKTVTGAGPYTVTTETDHGFLVNDLIRAQRFTGSGVYQCNMQVTAVASTTQFTGTLTSGNAPAAGMEFVRLGNTTDATRQNSIYMTADDTNNPYMDVLSGVNSFASWGTDARRRLRIGNLAGITDAALNPSGYGLYADSAFLKGDLVTGNGYIRVTQASGIDIQEDANSYTSQRAIQWWPNVNSPSGNPSLGIYEYKVTSGFTANQNFAYMETYPTGGVMATLWMDARGQGGADDAYIYLQGGSVALGATPVIAINGAVGIGTSAPGYQLDVNGAIRSGGTSAIVAFDDRTTGWNPSLWGWYAVNGYARLWANYSGGFEALQCSVNNFIVNVPLGSGWTALTYNTGWASYGGGWAAAQYTKFGDRVRVHGLVKRTSGSASIVGTLPAVYRPTTNKMFATIVHNGTSEVVCRLDVDPSGNINCMTNPATINYLSLDVIEFSISI